MRNQVINWLESTGMWTRDNRAKYDFLLSPEVFPINEAWINQLGEFAETLQDHFTQVTGTYPALCKVDLMVDRNGCLKVAEVDGLNKRALGYAVLERQIAKLCGHSSSKLFGGCEQAIERRLSGQKLYVVVPGREKYYQFGFNILISALRDLGIDAAWGHEKAALRFLQTADPAEVALLDCPETGHAKLDSLLQSKPWRTLIPNHSVFSCKENLVDLRSHLVPKTVVAEVNGSVPSLPFDQFVLKTPDRSGCKGVHFWDELPNELPAGRYVAQAMIHGQEFELAHFDAEGRLVRTSGWQVRLIATLDLAAAEVVDVDVTACRGRLVHGMAESIQIAGVRA